MWSAPPTLSASESPMLSVAQRAMLQSVEISASPLNAMLETSASSAAQYVQPEALRLPAAAGAGGFQVLCIRS